MTTLATRLLHNTCAEVLTHHEDKYFIQVKNLGQRHGMKHELTRDDVLLKLTQPDWRINPRSIKKHLPEHKI